ncbi:MAG: hypothetical protein ACXABY_22375, partial [Candidatus Thorarchaeota archaeon]
STDSAILFIKGWWVDDAAAIQYQVQDPKEPLFGYRDKHWRDVAEGNVMVHGAIDINFRYKGYLTFLLANLNFLQADIDKSRRAGNESKLGDYANYLRGLNPDNNLRNAGLHGSDFTAEQRKKLLEASVEDFDLRKFRRLANALKEDYWRNQPYATRAAQAAATRGRVGTWPDGFNIDVVFAQNEVDDITKNQDPGLVETLVDVRIVGQSKIIQNTVPGGGEPLLERYQFIAKDLK